MTRTLMTDEQRSRIFGLIRELGWSDEERHDAILGWIGKPSLSAKAKKPVTEREAEAVVGHLNVEVARQRSRRRREHKRARANWPANRATPEQIAEIWRVGAKIYGRSNEGREALLTWLAKYFKAEHPSRLSLRRATDVIAALHKMQREGWQPKDDAETAAR